MKVQAVRSTRQDVWWMQKMVSTVAKERFLIIPVSSRTVSTATLLRKDLLHASLVNFCTQAVRRMLHEGILRSWMTCKRTFLNFRHHKDRLEWAMDMQGGPDKAGNMFSSLTNSSMAKT